MHRFFVPDLSGTSEFVSLSREESRHASQVLRLRNGDDVVLLDGCGHEAAGVLDRVEKNAVTIALKSRRAHPAPACAVTLAQAIPKGRHMDSIIQKATELGAARVLPVMTARTISQPGADAAAQKVQKWNAAAIEAVKQCGNPWRPQILPPTSFARALEFSPGSELSVCASLSEPRETARLLLEQFHAQHARPPASLTIWIGPEGDFAPEEYAKLLENGTRALSLGRSILRCDTAAVAALAIIFHELESLAPAPGRSAHGVGATSC